MTNKPISPWQRPDGWPTDNYFETVKTAIRAAGIEVDDEETWREEDWEYTLRIAQAAVENSPFSWAEHGLYICWRLDETTDPLIADEVEGMGWYFVPHSRHGGTGDYAHDLLLGWRSEPDEVAAGVLDLLRNGDPTRRTR